MKRRYKNELKLAKSDYYSQLINNSTNKIKTTRSVVSETITNISKNISVHANMDARKINDLFINNVEQVVLNISTNDYALEYLNAMKRVNTAVMYLLKRFMLQFLN